MRLCGFSGCSASAGVGSETNAGLDCCRPFSANAAPERNCGYLSSALLLPSELLAYPRDIQSSANEKQAWVGLNSKYWRKHTKKKKNGESSFSAGLQPITPAAASASEPPHCLVQWRYIPVTLPLPLSL